MHPWNDKIKVKIRKEGHFENPSVKKECGIVVEVPDRMFYLGFHSFAFDTSLGAGLEKIIAEYKSLEGKLVVWESLKDSGRHFIEEGEDYVILNMTDIIAYSDDVDADIQTLDTVGSAGSFNLQ